MSDRSPSILRQEWLEDAGEALIKLLGKHGYDIPNPIRYTIGFPKGSHGGKRAIGQCWATAASDDQHNEIFVSPELGHKGKPNADISVRVMGVLAHEFAHAVCGHKAGHRIVRQPKEPASASLKAIAKHKNAVERYRMSFPVVGTVLGLEPPWIATTEGAVFDKWARAVIKDIGPFPAGALNLSSRVKQSTRLRKCQCVTCGYIARVTAKWVDSAGAPLCPTDQIAMVCDMEEEEG